MIINEDITSIEYGVIAHGVNCQGVMGSGVAKSIREKWPEVYESYRYFYLKNRFKGLLGDYDIVTINPKLIIVNSFTQEHYGRDGKVYADLNAVIGTFKLLYNLSLIYKIPAHAPKIGCGLGGLNWEKQVEPFIHKDITIYETC